MRQLRTCDFCGDEAVGTFEIVPPELNPGEAEQRRVVLCADCQPTLEELLEPLLVRAGADAATDPTGGESGRDDGGSDRATGDADADGGARSAATDRSQGTASDETDSSGTPGLDGTDSDADDSVVPDAVVTPDTDERSGLGTDEGVAIGGGSADRDRNEGADGAAGSNADSGEGSGPDSERAAAPGTGMKQQEGAAETPSPPRAYAKVLRLLQNREFPMARSDVEGLAAGAYDLEDDEVTAIIDHAVDQGDLELDGRQIRLA